MKNNYRNNSPIINLYKKRNTKSKIDTQLLYGDNFTVLKRQGNWRQIRIKKDRYVGFIKSKRYSNPVRANFKVSVLKANIFSKPNLKNKLKVILPFDSRLRIKKRSGKFGNFGRYWIKYSDLKKINHKNRDVFKYNLNYLNFLYRILWDNSRIILGSREIK